MFPLFQAGHGRFSNNYSQSRESYVPEYQPGGGGFNIFCFNLRNLYSENQHLLNWWTTSNKHLNLVRYKYVRLRLYREKEVDYVFTYQREYPMEVGKYHYPSTHPQRMLLYKHKVIVPSYASAPQKKKPYIQLKVKPPHELIDKWYFQQYFSRVDLLMCSVVACSLNNMFQNPNSVSNNVTLLCLNTRTFRNANFKTAQQTTGYSPQNNYYLYGLSNGTLELSKITQGETIFLGQTQIRDHGDPRGNQAIANYGYAHWGNPFWHEYLDGSKRVLLGNKPYTETLKDGGQTTITGVTLKQEPLVYRCRYNPFKDTGVGNEMYWLPTTKTTENWDATPNPDLKIAGFPLWILGWGWEDWTNKLGVAKNLYYDYVLVIKSDFIEPKLPGYVILSESFFNGEGPYNLPGDQLNILDYKNWYPRWAFQKEALENLLMTGPAVCKAPYVKSIQAHMEYDFLFKWGGNPAYFQNNEDPASQPVYPLPTGFLLQNEINNPETSIFNELYNFDIRRDLITKTALQRITGDSLPYQTLFTDGTQPSPFEPKIYKENAQEKEAQKETETQTQQHLQLIQQYNNQLRQQLNKLMLINQNM